MSLLLALAKKAMAMKKSLCVGFGNTGSSWAEVGCEEVGAEVGCEEVGAEVGCREVGAVVGCEEVGAVVGCEDVGAGDANIHALLLLLQLTIIIFQLFSMHSTLV